mmetsp:Transcript_1588/g.5603  ORF Transcript_1588/g.5603 Transcript_1588/m.5603 type:complete len:217 (-) Transcript_1588:354-1004(-)
MKPVMFCRKTSGTCRWQQSSTKWAPLTAASEKRMPLLATMPTCWPCRCAKPVTSVGPYSRLNSWKRLPSTRRAMTSRTSKGVRGSAGTRPSRAAGSCSGGSGARSGGWAAAAAGAGPFSEATMRRAMARACASSCARWSVTPDVRQWSSAPPSSSAVTSSPVAALTSGGPPRKMVPWRRTMTDSSAMAGTYAPPAVHEPSTTATCATPAALICAWL